MRNPIVKGGQGRLASDVERDAENVIITMLLALCFVVCLVAKGCSSSPKPKPVPAAGSAR